MMKLLRTQDWSGDFAYAPPLRDTVINLDDVASAVECDSRGSGPWMRVTLRSGGSFVAQGRPSDLVAGAGKGER